jgi:hypothetical protein
VPPGLPWQNRATPVVDRGALDAPGSNKEAAMSAVRFRLSSAALFLVLGVVLALVSEAALALAQRTFVASNGNDANTCSLVLPCRSFATALGQTQDGGEIVVLDSAGYGTLTIDRSVRITAPPGVYAGITAITSAIGVTITGNSLVVVLRGLTINVTDPSSLQGSGIHVISNNSRVLVQHAFISGFQNGVSVANDVVGNRVNIEDSFIDGCGIGVEAVGGNFMMIDRVRITGGGGVQVQTAHTHVRDSVIEPGGISVQGNTGPGALHFIVENSTLSLGGGIQILLAGSPVSGGIEATVSNTVVSGNLGNGILVACDLGATGTVTIADSTVSDNGLNPDEAGILASGGTCSVAVSHSVISGNAGPSIVNAGGGTFVSFGDNRMFGNHPDTPSGTVTVVPTR